MPLGVSQLESDLETVRADLVALGKLAADFRAIEHPDAGFLLAIERHEAIVGAGRDTKCLARGSGVEGSSVLMLLPVT